MISFFAGYRVGVKDGTLSAIPPMLDMERFFIAARLAGVVSGLHDIKSNGRLDQRSICKMKKIVLEQIDDWNDCKQNKSCRAKVSLGFYAKTDEKIADFMAVKCD